MRLDARSFAPGDRYPRREWQELLDEHLAGGPVRILVATIARDVIGAIVTLHFAGEEDANLASIAVAASHQREGIGRHLLREAVRLLPAVVQTLTLEVRVDNAAARALYARLGFEPVGTIQHYYGDGATAVEYVVPLTTLREQLDV